MFSSLAIRDFRPLWTGILCAAFAMNMQIIARGWLAYNMTGSAVMLTWVVIAFFVPQAVLSLFGGAFADRFHKKRIMIIAQSLNAVATLAMALQVYSGRVTFADFIYFGVFNGTVIALSFPARQSIIPEIVGEKNVFNAMSMVAASWNLARILGPAMAGLRGNRPGSDRCCQQ